MSRKRVRTPYRELRLPGRFGCRSKLNRFRHHARGSRLSSCVQIRIGASISVRHQYGKSETDLKREGARCANARTLGKRFVVFQPHTGFTMGEKSRSEEITIFASYRDSPGKNCIGFTQCNECSAHLDPVQNRFPILVQTLLQVTHFSAGGYRPKWRVQMKVST